MVGRVTPQLTADRRNPLQYVTRQRYSGGKHTPPPEVAIRGWREGSSMPPHPLTSRLLQHHTAPWA
ncbi:hypothetical protein BD414DRAFT_252942 [Trametes punicea]|nr:hypothetical protein BD414DRAFT_252942 [Trametes punicea]